MLSLPASEGSVWEAGDAWRAPGSPRPVLLYRAIGADPGREGKRDGEYMEESERGREREREIVDGSFPASVGI